MRIAVAQPRNNKPTQMRTRSQRNPLDAFSSAHRFVTCRYRQPTTPNAANRAKRKRSSLRGEYPTRLIEPIVSRNTSATPLHFYFGELDEKCYARRLRAPANPPTAIQAIRDIIFREIYMPDSLVQIE